MKKLLQFFIKFLDHVECLKKHKKNKVNENFNYLMFSGTIGLPAASPSIIFTKDYTSNKYVKLMFRDILEIENTMPLSDGVKIFLDELKNSYDTEVGRLQKENKKLKDFISKFYRT